MKYRSLICLLIAALFSASCEKENGTAVHSRYIRFNASVNAALEYEVKSTKAGEGKFAEGTHNMGLWLCNPSNSPILPEFANTKVEYTVNPTIPRVGNSTVETEFGKMQFLWMMHVR